MFKITADPRAQDVMGWLADERFDSETEAHEEIAAVAPALTAAGVPLPQVIPAAERLHADQARAIVRELFPGDEREALIASLTDELCWALGSTWSDPADWTATRSGNAVLLDYHDGLVPVTIYGATTEGGTTI